MDDLRYLQMHLLRFGHDNAVACGVHLLERRRNPVVFALGLRKLAQKLHQLGIIANLKARLLGKHLIKQRLREIQYALDRTRAEINCCNMKTLHLFQLSDARQRRLGLAQTRDLGGMTSHCLIKRALNRVFQRQSLHPAGQIKPQFGQREFVHQLRQNLLDLRDMHGQAVGRHAVDVIRLVQCAAERLRSF